MKLDTSLPPLDLKEIAHMTKQTATPKELEQLYDSISRVSQERNDFFLPQIIDFVIDKRWMNTRPEYQRRLVWDNKKKSRFIESLLMNIPIPPVFLYEHELSRYEVMDGQQRINTVLEFYDNTLKLTGLQEWSALNGFRRKDCPEKIQRGLDRRRISATVLLAETGQGSEAIAQKLRREVFERLNTGGQLLNAQELRNSMYTGPFNDLLIDLAGNALFNDLWDMPRYDDHYNRKTGQISDELAQDRLFKRMLDCEIVLRFFAFRDKSHISGAVKAILDRCMERHVADSAETIDSLREDFTRALVLAHRIFGDHTFKLKNQAGHFVTSQPLFDAVMVSLDRLKDREDDLVAAQHRICGAFQKEMVKDHIYGIIVGRPNTATALKGRISLVQGILESAIK